MYEVMKRDGSIVKFDLQKIKAAIKKSFDSTNKAYNNDILDLLALRVSAKLETDEKVVSVETIQDSVEKVLSESGYSDIAKSYILYRKQREKIRNAKSSVINYKELVDNYLKVNDWRVKENSTVNYSVGGLILSNSGAITANYWLSEVYDEEIANAHRSCDIHLHDLGMLAPYCAGWNLKQLIQEGLGGVPGKITSAPAEHLSTLCNQMVNFLGILQNEWAGAQAFSSFDTYLAPFVKVDNLSYKEVKQCIQSFIYGVNTPSRWGTQAPFTNVTLDWTIPDDLKDLPAIVGGKEMDFTYGDCKNEMDMVNKAFIEVMIEGDANGRGFQYPIPTYSITKDFDWSETENNKLLFEMTAKYGTPYFSNYINSDMSPQDVRSMCVVPDTSVWARIDGKNTSHCTIEYLYNNFNPSASLILTKYGYRPIKEVQKFEYKGKLLKFVTDTGKEIISTPDHEHIIYKDGKLVKKKAFELNILDEFSVRRKNPGESRKGKTYEDIYGFDKARSIKDLYKDQRKGQWVGEKNPAFSGLNNEWRKNISKGLVGHYVSEECKRKSSERWQGENNPYVLNGLKVNGKSASISKYEEDFYNELDALGLDFIYQYGIKDLNYICDFYIPEKNLIIELETDYRWDKCSYNNTDDIFVQNLKNKYDAIINSGYNLLVFNPAIDNSSYREFINNKEKIVSIEEVQYDGFVYDLEVDCDDIEEDTSLHHAFYANDILTGNCCRLRLDLRELRRKGGGFFGSGESTGSIGVVTINLPRIAYIVNTKEEFFNRLDKLMDISARSLDIKRRVLVQLMDSGLYPYTKRYLGNLNNHFSTIGLIGMNEAGLNAKWLKKDLTDPETQKFAKEVLNHMRNRLSDYQEKYGDLFNLEATPAESTTYRFAKHDKEQFPDIITANMSGTPYYTNSSHLPVGFTEDVFSALDIQDELQTLYTSGTVFHAFLGEKLPNWKSAAALVRKIAENYKLPYYTMSPTYSVCKDHGYISGEHSRCPICGKPTEVYSRITGYYRPVQNWNDGKAQEFRDRKVYNIGRSTTPHHNEENIEKPIENNNIEVKEEIKPSEEKELILVKTKTCPNCKMIQKILDDNKIKYEVVLADEDIDFAKKNDIRIAPTLLIKSGDSIEKISGAGPIRTWLNK